MIIGCQEEAEVCEDFVDCFFLKKELKKKGLFIYKKIEILIDVKQQKRRC